MTAEQFDCVQLKHDIQQRLLDELRGLSAEERARRTEAIIQQDPLLARIWQRARRTGAARPAAKTP
jgi:hypothetical protein